MSRDEDTAAHLAALIERLCAERDEALAQAAQYRAWWIDAAGGETAILRRDRPHEPRRLSDDEVKKSNARWDSYREFAASRGHAGHNFQGSNSGGEPIAWWCVTCAEPIGIWRDPA